MSGFRAMQGAKSREQQRYFEISATPQSTKAAIKTVFRINQRLLKGKKVTIFCGCRPLSKP